MKFLRSIGPFWLWLITIPVSFATTSIMQAVFGGGLLIGFLAPWIITLAYMAYRQPTESGPKTLHPAFACLWVLSFVGGILLLPAIGIGINMSSKMSSIHAIDIVICDSLPVTPLTLVTLFWLAHTACRDPHRIQHTLARALLFGAGLFGIVHTLSLFRK